MPFLRSGRLLLAPFFANRPAVLFFAACVSLIACSHPRTPVLAITHVAVIDMTGAAPLVDQTVIIDGHCISNLGPSNAVAIPGGAQVFDARGKFLIPGLVDMHIHLTAAGEPDGSRKFIIPLLLANGITSVRDMGGYLESLIPLRKEIDEGKRLGPRIVTPGPYLDGSPPSFQPSFVVTNSVEANEDVHQLVTRGVDFIKVQSILSRDAYFAIAQAAQREHIVFVGHVPDRVTAAEAADAGQHSIEHLTNVLRGCSRDEPKLMREQFYITRSQQSPTQSRARESRWLHRLLDAYSPEAAAPLIAKFKEKDVWQTPTLILLKNDAFPTLENSAVRVSGFKGSSYKPLDKQVVLANPELEFDRAKFIPSRTLDTWEQSRAEQMKTVSPQDSDLHLQLLRKSMNLVAEMQKAGVKILAGTDSPAPYVFPGSSLHDELQLLVEAGLTPFEALQAATKSPAEFLHAEKDSGTIEKGKYADLVLLDANPLENIRNSRKIRAVILRGKLLNRPVLDQLFVEVQEFANTN